MLLLFLIAISCMGLLFFVWYAKSQQSRVGTVGVGEPRVRIHYVGPPLCLLGYKLHVYYSYSSIMDSPEIGLMFTSLAISFAGPHSVNIHYTYIVHGSCSITKAP